MVANQKVKKRIGTTEVDDSVSVENDSDYEEIDETENLSEEEMKNNINKSSHNGNFVSNAGWADAMRKILKTNKPKGKKTIVLSKAKKLCVVKDKEEKISFEVNGPDEIKTNSKETSAKIEQISQSKKQKLKDKSLSIRIKPSITDRTHERLLQKIATKGVVQLFNAVRQQQTTISKKVSEAGPLERKREEALKNINKNTFLNLLMGNSKSISVENTDKIDKPVQQTNNENKDEKIWSVLRDDFIMKAGLKDWDKKEDTEEDSSASEELDDDDDDDDDDNDDEE